MVTAGAASFGVIGGSSFRLHGRSSFFRSSLLTGGAANTGTACLIVTGGATRTGGTHIPWRCKPGGGGRGGAENTGTDVLIITGGAILWQGALICRMGT